MNNWIQAMDRTWIKHEHIVTVKGVLTEVSDGFAARAEVQVVTGKVYHYDFGLTTFAKDDKARASEVLAVQVRSLLESIT